MRLWTLFARPIFSFMVRLASSVAAVAGVREYMLITSLGRRWRRGVDGERSEAAVSAEGVESLSVSQNM